MNSIPNRRSHGWPGLKGLAKLPGVALVICGLLLIMMTDSLPAEALLDAPSEYQVKAAFLFNFGKFTGWPPEVFTNASAPLVIGVYGGNPFHHDLEQLVAGKQIGGHPVEVRQITVLSDLKNCHVVFVNSPDPKQAARILSSLDHAPVLTVTENLGHFQESNFMINFVLEDNRIHFEINNEAARSCRVKISSKLLALGRPPGK